MRITNKILILTFVLFILSFQPKEDYFQKKEIINLVKAKNSIYYVNLPSKLRYDLFPHYHFNGSTLANSTIPVPPTFNETIIIISSYSKIKNISWTDNKNRMTFFAWNKYGNWVNDITINYNFAVVASKSSLFLKYKPFVYIDIYFRNGTIGNPYFGGWMFGYTTKPKNIPSFISVRRIVETYNETSTFGNITVVMDIDNKRFIRKHYRPVKPLPDNIIIGYGYTGYLVGDIYFVIIYDRVLNDNEVSQIKLNPLNPPREGLKVFLSPFSINGNIWRDQSGNGYNFVSNASIIEPIPIIKII